MCFVARILKYKIFVAGTTLENQMQLSVSTLTVSRNLKKQGRRQTYHYKWVGDLLKKSFQFGDVYWEKYGVEKKQSKKDIKPGKVRDQSRTSNLSCHTVSESGEKWTFFFSWKQLVLLREFFMGSIKTAN